MGGGVVFQMGEGFILKRGGGGAPCAGIGCDGGVQNKSLDGEGVRTPMPSPLLETLRGYMLQKNMIGGNVGFLFFFHFFVIVFFSAVYKEHMKH